MKRILLMVCCMLVICSGAFAKQKTVLDYDPDFFNILPWYADEETNGENEEKGRMEEGSEVKKEEKTGEKTVEKAVNSIDLVVILDKSGSMYSMVDDTIGGFNSYLDEQRKKDIPVKVSMGMFNQKLEEKYSRVDLKDVKNLTNEDYVPQGMTALFDAVGNTLSALKTDEGVNAEGNKVLVVIITDGMENASSEWTKSTVKGLIGELRGKGYEFVFLGADIDAADVAEDIGISRETSMKFKKTGAGVKGNFKAMSVMMDTVSEGSSLVRDIKWKSAIVEDK